MAKGEQKGNREAKKPKKEKIKTIAAAPSEKAAGWQPGFASGKKKEQRKRRRKARARAKVRSRRAARSGCADWPIASRDGLRSSTRPVLMVIPPAKEIG